MHLLNLNLHRGGAINAVAYGSFTGANKGKSDEVLVARGNVLELLRVDEHADKLVSLVQTPAFCVVRSLQSFRQQGTLRDFCAVGSDSGKITILEYVEASHELRAVHCEAFGKTGCRRIVPGELLAADPAGRSVMIAALEKQKLVYTLSRDTADRLTITSPLEAHKAHGICYSIVGLHVHYDNPIFAAIELDYQDADADSTGQAAAETEKHLVYYQMDLGLNHVTRFWSAPISRAALFLLAVPGTGVGPGGVLICGENWVSYRHKDHPEIRAALPRRRGTPATRGLLITCGYMYKPATARPGSKGAKMWFALLQSELGDVYKVTLDVAPAGPAALALGKEMEVQDIRVEYFDTLPPATALAVTSRGTLFVACEYGDHLLLRFTQLGDPDDIAVVSRRCDDAELGDDAADAAQVAPEFETRPLRNLQGLDRMESLAPATELLVADLDQLAAAAASGSGASASGSDGAQQLYVLSGRGPGSSLRILRHGLAVAEIARSELPGHPSGVWAVRQRIEDEHHAFIVLSFVDSSLVLGISETESIEEVKDNGFLLTTPTLGVVLLANGSILQVHPTGVRMFRPGQHAQEWRTPGRKTIEKAAANSRQVIIAQAGGEITYFELEPGRAVVEEIGSKELGLEISCMELGEVPENRVRSPFLVCGDWSGSIRVYSLERNNLLEQLSIFHLQAPPESLRLISMLSEQSAGAGSGAAAAGAAAAGSAEAAAAAAAAADQLFCFIGLTTGVCERVAVDPTSGTLSDPRRKFLGSKPVKLFAVPVDGRSGVLALSGRSWLSYNYQGRYHMAPLSYESLDYAAGFSTAACPEGVVAISGKTMRIFAMEGLGQMFNQQSIPLRYTPRQLAQLPGPRPLLVIAEADNDEYTQKERAALLSGGGLNADIANNADEDAEMADAALPPPPPPPPFPPGVPPPPPPPLPAGGSNGMDVDGYGNPTANGNAATENGGDEDAKEADEEEFRIPIRGPLPSKPGKWASCLTVLDPSAESSRKPLHVLELSDDEAALSLTIVTFASRGEETYVAVGTARRLTFHPLRHEGCYVHVYRLIGNKLHRLHKTEVPAPPLALRGFEGLLLVGTGRSLRLYDLGKLKLLRKCENKQLPTMICCMSTIGDRAFVGDAAESIHVVRYRRAENRLALQADDSVPRAMSRVCALDYDTAIGSDKFGGVFILRAPPDAADELGLDLAVGNRALWENAAATSSTAALGGANTKLEQLVQLYIGEVVTALKKTNLVVGGQDAIVYVTISGSVGALMPFTSREDADFFTHLEMFMRQEYITLCGREHTSYRSYYLPVRHVVDGDLCERFAALSPEKQKQVAAGLDRSIAEVLKKLEDARNRIL